MHPALDTGMHLHSPLHPSRAPLSPHHIYCSGLGDALPLTAWGGGIFSCVSGDSCPLTLPRKMPIVKRD